MPSASSAAGNLDNRHVEIVCAASAHVNVSVLYQFVDSANWPWPTDVGSAAAKSRSGSARFGRGDVSFAVQGHRRALEGQPSRCPLSIGCWARHTTVNRSSIRSCILQAAKHGHSNGRNSSDLRPTGTRHLFGRGVPSHASLGILKPCGGIARSEDDDVLMLPCGLTTSAGALKTPACVCLRLSSLAFLLPLIACRPALVGSTR
jgi:hypothetical protein